MPSEITTSFFSSTLFQAASCIRIQAYTIGIILLLPHWDLFLGGSFFPPGWSRGGCGNSMKNTLLYSLRPCVRPWSLLIFVMRCAQPGTLPSLSREIPFASLSKEDPFEVLQGNGKIQVANSLHSFLVYLSIPMEIYNKYYLYKYLAGVFASFPLKLSWACPSVPFSVIPLRFPMRSWGFQVPLAKAQHGCVVLQTLS